MKLYLAETGNENWIEEIIQMIYWHHKMTQYTGKNKNLVENFRKADWIDVSLGLITFGCKQNQINEYQKNVSKSRLSSFLDKRYY